MRRLDAFAARRRCLPFGDPFIAGVTPADPEKLGAWGDPERARLRAVAL